MKKYFILFYLFSSLNLISLEITVEKAYQLGLQFIPQKLVDCCDKYPDSCEYKDFEGATFGIRDDIEHGYKPDGKERYPSWGTFKFIVFKMPNDQSDYVLLAWLDCIHEFCWVLIKTNDGGQTFQKVCDNSEDERGAGGFGWGVRLNDLTGDGIPELLAEGVLSGSGQFENLVIWQWQNGCFKCISKEGFDSNSYISIEDIDDDGVAEIIVGPMIERFNNSEEPDVNDITWEAVSNGQVWHFENGLYRLWYEFGPTEENHIYVPSIAVFHPSTIPLSELSNPGNGKIKLFVSDPPSRLSVDDFKKDSFKYGPSPLSFKKIWKNKNYPDESFANYSFMDVPVRQILRKSQGEWQTNPSDPFLLSPDKKLEYHFIGDYVELEMQRKELFPYLLKVAQENFSRHPESTITFVSIVIRGKFNNGKISNTIAIVAVKK